MERLSFTVTAAGNTYPCSIPLPSLTDLGPWREAYHGDDAAIIKQLTSSSSERVMFQAWARPRVEALRDGGKSITEIEALIPALGDEWAASRGTRRASLSVTRKSPLEAAYEQLDSTIALFSEGNCTVEQLAEVANDLMSRFPQMRTVVTMALKSIGM